MTESSSAERASFEPDTSTCCSAPYGQNVRLEYVTVAVGGALLLAILVFGPSTYLVSCYCLAMVASILGIVALKNRDQNKTLILASATASVVVAAMFCVLAVLTVVGLVRAIQEAEHPEHDHHEHSYIIQVLLTGVVVAGGLLLFGLGVSCALANKHVRHCRSIYRKGAISPFSVVYMQEDEGQQPTSVPLPVATNWPPPYQATPPPLPPPYNEPGERYNTAPAPAAPTTALSYNT